MQCRQAASTASRCSGAPRSTIRSEAMTDNPSAVRRWRVFPPHVDEVVAASDHDATVSALQRELATERAAREKAEVNARRWLHMYENDMSAEYRDHTYLLLNPPPGKPHGSLFASVVDAAMQERA